MLVQPYQRGQPRAIDEPDVLKIDHKVTSASADQRVETVLECSAGLALQVTGGRHNRHAVALRDHAVHVALRQMGAAAHARRSERPAIIQSSDACADCQLQERSAVRCVMTGSLANRLASLCRMGKVINSSLVLDEVLDLVLII